MEKINTVFLLNRGETTKAKSETIKAAYKRAKELIGTFDVVVNGSGVANEGNIDQLVQINLGGLMHSSLTAMDYMSKANGGQGGYIINIGSITGLNPTDFCGLYGATKSGVINFTNTMAKPLYFDKTGVSFVTICPGVTLTTMLKDVVTKCLSAKYLSKDNNLFDSVIDQTPAEFAENLVKVLESAANGTIWVLDGGKIHEAHLPEIWGPALRYKTRN
ncbi:fat body protein 2-like [Musca vetustissima]|uniref:fat body protein 2-like n=1 Tax=Musca vetustissima TaxID=27455 RepID=UPI002AB68CC2|nr:fat body protein 2-like [Musca vetustissima]